MACHKRHGQHKLTDDVGRGMTSSPLDDTHDQTTSGVACHHNRWAAHRIERNQAWNDITALGQHTRSNDVGRGMTSPPLGSTHDQMTSGVACNHRLWAAHTLKRSPAWHDITALGLHARLEDVGCGMTSPPLDSTDGQQRRAWHDITAFGQHTRSNDVGRYVPSPHLDNSHGRTTSGME